MNRIILKYAVYAALGLALAGSLWWLDRVRTELHDANQLIASYRTAYRLAKDDAKTAADQCQARVDAARISARRIEQIIERPIHVDPQGCAVRSLVPSDELRDALQP